MIRPLLHHPDALVPVLTARVGTADGIVVAMRKLALDGIRIPAAHLVEQRRSQRPKAVAGHLVLREAHAP